ncbi:DUF2848 family protein [Paraburkholderia phenazinium]|nr:DUF2848 family protein [Paraburkholderia phenazinium]
MSADNGFAFDILRQGSSDAINVPINRLIVAGWTGRDQRAVRRHILELDERGVPGPETIPIFWRVPASRLTRADEIDGLGTANSGAVAFVLFQHEGELYVSVGSDHTGSDVVAREATVSKQMCDKPVAMEAWPFSEVASHWDHIFLRAWIVEDGERTLYQDGQVSALLDPAVLLDALTECEQGFGDGTLIYSGTFDLIGERCLAPRLEVEMYDPVLERSITHGYNIVHGHAEARR